MNLTLLKMGVVWIDDPQSVYCQARVLQITGETLLVETEDGRVRNMKSLSFLQYSLLRS